MKTPFQSLARGPSMLRLRSRVLKMLKIRLLFAEILTPTEWQVTLFWAGLIGFGGGLSSIIFRDGVAGLHRLITGSSGGLVESFESLTPAARLLTPALGGLLAGLVLLLGTRLVRSKSTTDYMEAIAIGDGRISFRSSLVKSIAAMFSIASGGSIGREGPMVQLSSMLASHVGRWRRFPPPRLRLLVGCGAAAGIASAYNAPIAGSFFVAEIILGSFAMESLGPLVFSSVMATMTVRALSNAQALYQAPPFRLQSAWEMPPYLILGALCGLAAPCFLRSLRQTEHLFVRWQVSPLLKLTIGGLIVGILAVWSPEVCGNGYSIVLSILHGERLWQTLLLVVLMKWLATAASFGSGAPGGIFTPTLFMGASLGYLFGTGAHALLPAQIPDARAYALVGMGSFLAAASHAPLMAIILLFEMTLSYDIIMPLMIASVVAYYTSKTFVEESLYQEALKRKAAEHPKLPSTSVRVSHLMKANPPTVRDIAPFAEVVTAFLANRIENLYVVNEEGDFVGVVSLHDIKPFLNEPDIASAVLAQDILRENLACVTPDRTVLDALKVFSHVEAERLPVVESETTKRLLGSLSKSDLLLALAESQSKTTT